MNDNITIKRCSLEFPYVMLCAYTTYLTHTHRYTHTHALGELVFDSLVFLVKALEIHNCLICSALINKKDFWQYIGPAFYCCLHSLPIRFH